MARDYANRSRKRGKSSSNGRLWLITLVLIALFVGGLLYLRQHPPAPEPNQQQPVLATAAKPKQPPKPQSAAPAVAPMKFDFYNILPKVKVPAPQEDNSAKAPPKAPTLANTPNGSTAQSATSAPATTTAGTVPAYVLQLGAFKDFASADQIKAQVTLLGFDVNVKTVQKKDGTSLYRVFAGPYATYAKAKDAQHQLAGNQIKSVIVKE